MVTMKDISRITGYSMTTVSKALNGYTDISDECRKKILDTCHDLNYVPSALGRNLSIKRSFTIGVVFSEETNQGITHPFFSELLNEFKEEVEKRGYDILLLGKKVGPYVHSYLTHCRQKAIDGILLLSVDSLDPAIPELIESNIPKVIMQSKFKNQYCFFSDNFQSICEIVKYAVSMGHKKIGFIHGDVYTYEGKERLEAFLSEMENQKQEINHNWVFDGKNYTTEEGKAIGRKWLQLVDKPTIMICSSDTLAVGCMLEVLSSGYKIPDDLSFTGFDNINLSTIIQPTLTTIDQNKKALAFEATDCLIKQIEHKYIDKMEHIVPCEIIYRNSVKNLN